jgi:nucleoside 2-deoxyribosyltransferase
MADPSQTTKLYYLASPYSHEDAAVREQRFHQVNEIAIDLINRGYVVIEPIVMGHPKVGQLPTDYEFWKRVNTAHISRCDGVIVADTIDGWSTSKGVTAEIQYAKSLGKRVIMYSSITVGKVPASDSSPTAAIRTEIDRLVHHDLSIGNESLQCLLQAFVHTINGTKHLTSSAMERILSEHWMCGDKDVWVDVYIVYQDIGYPTVRYTDTKNNTQLDEAYHLEQNWTYGDGNIEVVVTVAKRV